MARIKRRQIVLAILIVIAIGLGVSLFSEEGAKLGVGAPAWIPKPTIPSRMLHRQVPLVKTPAYAAAPGFESALPSCRVTDLPNDPLVTEYGQNNIRLSRTYEGSGVRVRRVLQKAIRGEPIKIAVMGGSVSTGHSLTWPHTAENHMHLRVHKWFQDTFPGAEHTINTDSAIPAVTARYFSYCIHETLPDDVDLILLEMDINHDDPTPESLRSTEAMYRTILSLPNQPAVIYMSVFALVFQDLTHGWRHSALISQWLDVPEINIRNWMLPHVMKHPEAIPPLYLNFADDLDIRHVNGKGHRAMGDMVIAYLREQLCLLSRDGPVEKQPSNPMWPTMDISRSLPRLGMLQPWDETSSMPLLYPKCQSITSTKFPLQPTVANGWESVDRNDKKSFEATVPGSEISFNVHTDAGLLGMFFWMTNRDGFGQVACWVDGDQRDERIRRVAAYNPHHPASTFEHSGDLWNDLTPGDHIMTCRLETGPTGGNTFRIAATVTR
ncbi:hypothetical protein P389DRAFT_167095 [Cystobasidium minutum MCA 4210]|uniref:uncharacterized protein n=1 Tax=Cystobasidium minutum MCA 4210 TaxID=1397322 RepID=UPI0034CF2CD4|eukprot:jgi/Rhomi1/167095/fgenesh1_kg.2_\